MHVSTNDYRHRKAKLPSVKTYRKYVGKLIKRYKARGVKEWGVWNEENHYSEPTYRSPKRAGQYFHAMRSMCKGCTIVALDLLDSSNSARYIKAFYGGLSKKDRAAASLVGIHNYEDTNHHRKTGTAQIIKYTRRYNRHAKFWFTETGGIVAFGHFKCSQQRAANAINFMFALAKKYSHDVKRLYVYNWFGTKPSCHKFDAGLVYANGARRKGYYAVLARAKNFTR
jgi:hypothetical protein